MDSEFSFFQKLVNGIYRARLRSLLPRAGAELYLNDPREVVFTISTRLLYECFHYLNRDSHRESIIDISGIGCDDFITMERMEALVHDNQSCAYARSNLQSTFAMLMRIENYGGLLTGVFHIHPGNGFSSTCPSFIDTNDQLRREKVGMKAIGAIFSRDGYVRFFSVNLPFAIKVMGKGVKAHGRYLYELEDTGNL